MGFTKEQQNAIDARTESLIVSAAAGSGKTTVLVERVMQMILGGEADISSLIIVTFTEAAASEMKNKISTAISNKLEEDPGNTFLKRQLALMSRANIQTVHSFCSGIIKENFHLLGIPQDFKILEESERELMMEEALDSVMEEKYENYGKDPDFLALYKCFSEDRGDRQIRKSILELYEKLRSHPYPKKWLEYTIESVENFEEDKLDRYNWSKFLLSEAQSIISASLAELKSAYIDMQSAPQVFEKYAPAFESEIKRGEHMEKAFGEGWDEAYDALRIAGGEKLKPCRYDDKAYLDRLKGIRENFRKSAEEVCKNYIRAKAKYMVKEFDFTAPVIKGICRLVMQFERAFDDAKAENGVLDYSDLEHKALSLLTDSETGEKTDIAKKISSETYALLVDEVQDTNEIQDRIFQSIKPEKGNVFYVGDVKQSIYKFRLANPDIFIDKYISAKNYDDNDPSPKSRIDLNMNFRSSESVIDSINFVFKRIMSASFGGIDYDERQALHPGRPYKNQYPSELCVIDMELSDDDEMKKAEAEAEYVAFRIKEMLDNMEIAEREGTRRAKSGDFAILLSSYQNKKQYFQSALEKWGIPCSASVKTDFLKSTEIETVMSFLKMVDNPYQDIPLVSLMRSFLYDFSADDIARLRALQPVGYLYEGLVKLAETDEKAKRLKEDLAYYRNISKNMPVYRLLETVCDDYSMRWIVGGFENGDSRVENIGILTRAAEDFEKSGYKGLFRFISYAENRFSQNDEETGGDSGGVAIMSIHKSKGLEFPVVFLPDLTKEFNRDDVKKPILFHQDMQIGIKYRDRDRREVYKSQMYSAVAAKTVKELTEEEMRKLYVAMTRAKEKLIMVCSYKNAQSSLKKLADDCSFGITKLKVSKASSFAKWLVYAYLRHPDGAALRSKARYEGEVAAEGGPMIFKVISPDDIEKPLECAEKIEETADKKLEIPSWAEESYPYQNSTAMPSKISPTMLKRLRGEEQERMYTREKSSAGVERGNALHHLMEALDFEKCRSKSEIISQVEELYTSGKLKAEEKELVDMRDVVGFFESEIWDILKDCDRVEKEKQFAALFDTESLVSLAGDSMVVNGIVDLLIFKGDEIIIVDYKSDKVYGDAKDAALKHIDQINIYSEAAEKMYGKKVAARYIYLFSIGKAIKL